MDLQAGPAMRVLQGAARLGGRRLHGPADHSRDHVAAERSSADERQPDVRPQEGQGRIWRLHGRRPRGLRRRPRRLGGRDGGRGARRPGLGAETAAQRRARRGAPRHAMGQAGRSRPHVPGDRAARHRGVALVPAGAAGGRPPRLRVARGPGTGLHHPSRACRAVLPRRLAGEWRRRLPRRALRPRAGPLDSGAQPQPTAGPGRLHAVLLGARAER
mmetsp:Transcript_105688/g.227815  ORF Transcript_105688/g.227815 Transcript_105688/m.227815 type:complete len:216 (-) Transcript_105688:1381-2028(-)